MPAKTQLIPMSLAAAALLVSGRSAIAQQPFNPAATNAYAEVSLEDSSQVTPSAAGYDNIQLVAHCPTCPSGSGFGMGWARIGGGLFNGPSIVERNRQTSRWFINFLHGTGNCGTGTPVAGKYNMVYSVNPYHTDYRNGRMYSAAGYGTPVSVPLAPNVGHTYQYGWGMPSSRRVPISHPMPPAGYYSYPASR